MSLRSATRLRVPLRAATEFLHGEEASGLLLMLAAAAAVVWANWSGDSYERIWRTPLAVGLAPFALVKPLLLWINDGLMAVFFLLVALEIKREIRGGELASVRRAALPIAAALGGMIAPAAIYGVLNAGGPGARGWGIPMATDIAFALGVLALLGRRVAPSLRVFLAAVAIADDLGAVLVIALFYTGDLAWMPIGLAMVVFTVLLVVNESGIERATLYLLLGATLWLCVLESGVHATIAGVVLAFTIPPALISRLEHALKPWVALAILPLFALSNAGVRLTGGVTAFALDPITIGVVLGLFVGKQLGITASCCVLVRFGIASMPSGATWRQLYAVALLCGIGFTMSLFIATLAFGPSSRLEAAKIGVLAGSLLSGVAGYLVVAGRRNAA